METKFASGDDGVCFPTYNESKVWTEVPEEIQFPEFTVHTYYKKKFAFGGICREVYVYGSLTEAESEAKFSQLIIKLFDLFVEA